MVFFLRTSLGEDKIFELQPALAVTPDPRFWSLTSSCSPSGSGKSPRHGGNDAFNLLRIPIQPLSTPPNASAGPSSSSTMTTTMDGLPNGSPGTSALRDQARDMNSSAEKVPNGMASTGLEPPVGTMHNGLNHPTENGTRTEATTDVDRRAAPKPTRKSSIPLAPPFMVSAPGKVIVYGEHAVVHGKVRDYSPQGAPWNSR